MSEELQEQLEITLNELDHLPPDVGDDPVTELLSLARNFFRRIENVIDGSVASELFVVQSASDAYERFIRDIGSKTPRFRPVLKKNAGSDEFQEFPAALELDQLDTNTMTADILHLDDILQRAKRYAPRPCIYAPNRLDSLIVVEQSRYSRTSRKLSLSHQNRTDQRISPTLGKTFESARSRGRDSSAQGTQENS